MIIKATSHTMKNIWNFFLFIFLLITLFLVILTNGIRIENLNLPKIKISQLYIKLDKKLIVNIDTLNVNLESKKNTSLEELHDISKKLPYLHSFFKSISIQNIIFNNKIIHFLYKDEVFYIDSNFLTIDARIRPSKESIEVNIKQLLLKDFHLKLKGTLQANIKKQIFDFVGSFDTFNIHGGVEVRVENKDLYYRLNTQKFNSLKPFMDFISKKTELEPLISAWIYKKIVADEYQVHNLEGKFNLDTFNFYPNFMKATATAKNAVIKFDENAPSALVNELDIILKNNNLIFDVKKAEYQGKDISNTKVHIYNLMTVGAGIIIDINANTILDNSIHAVLHAFNISVPIIQTSGKTEASVKIDIKFLPFGVKSYSGYFKINDANISLSGLPLYSKSGYIELDNGMIYLHDVNLKYDTIFDIYTSGDLNLSTGIYKSKNKINSLHVNFSKLDLLHVEDFNTTARMQVKKNGTSIYVDSFKTNLEFLTDVNKIIVEKLDLFYPYSKLMQDMDIKDGNLEINTIDFKNYDIKAHLENMNLPLMKNKKQIKNIDLNIKTDGKNIEINSQDNNIKITKKDKLKIVIKNLDLTFDSSADKKPIGLGQMTVIGINSNIIDTNSTLKIPSERYVFKLNGTKMSFNSRLLTQTILIKKTDKTIYIESENLSDVFVNSALGKNVFEKGLFKLHVDGNNSKNLNGTFIAKNTTIKGMSFYNNLMAFMHTIPSLVTFKNPGFNDDGYAINNAFINFKRNGDILSIDEIKINGKSADITGSGTINLKTNELDINLQISVFKNLSAIVKAIPLVNYILLGEDGKMYTNVKVTGPISKPK